MGKKLKPVDRILLGLAFIDEILESTVGVGTKIYHNPKLYLFAPKNYKESAFKQNVYRLLKTGYLEKAIEKGKPVLKITRGGKKRLLRRFNYVDFQKRKWDGFWRIVIFDIPEKKKEIRRRLQSKLVELGFGMWQKSVYISPFDWEEDIDEFLIAQKLKGMAYVFTARHRLLGDAKELAKQVWKIDELSNQYEEVLYRLRKLETNPDKSKNLKLKLICHDYTSLLLKDPHLPKELLPTNWMGDKVNKELKSWM